VFIDPNGDNHEYYSRVEWKLEVVDGRYRKVPGVPENNWVWSPQGASNMHRPESWGYVQFSTSRPATVAFRPDASWPARRWLHEVYYGQQQYRRTHKRWARTFEELGVAPADGLLAQPALEVTADLFQASVELRLADKKPQRWNIRQDSLLWPD
jgi:hypothetical protein